MDNRLTRTWLGLLLRLLALIGAAALVGTAIGHPWPAICAVLVLILAHMLYRLYRLHGWLLSRQRGMPDDTWGIWSELQQHLDRRGNEGRQRQRRLLGLVQAFREAADALPDAIVHLTSDQRIVWFNHATLQLLGLHNPGDIGGVLTELVQEPRVLEWLRAGAGEPLLDVTLPDRGPRRLNFRLIRYGRAGEQLLVVRDATHLMHLEQMRRDFVANVSHELRTPLTVLHGYLDLLDPEDAPQLAPMLGEMRAQSTRMARLVEDLLTLSRLETGVPLQDERVRMTALIQTLLREALALSKGAHVVEARIDDDAPDLLGSTKELHSAFSNLISNAVRYTPNGGRITVRWQRAGNGAVLTVSDTGQGIASQHLSRITERFYRVSTSRSRETGGTGLGLSIVKHVLQLHQAHLEIGSELGAGSSFACHFDYTRVLPSAAATQDQPATTATTIEHSEQ